MERKIKVLIGDDSVEYGISCANALRSAGMHSITRPQDVRRILETIVNERPDIVIIDSSVLMRIDLIKKVKSLSGKKPKFIVISSYENFYAQGDADYFMLKPFDLETLINVVNSLFQMEKQTQKQDIEEAVTEIIQNIGIPAHIKGYRYIREAIVDSMENNELMDNITKLLYPMIASRFNATSSGVERAIRHAIEIAWNRGNYDIFTEYFGSKKPTNSEFIALIADKLKISHRCGCDKPTKPAKTIKTTKTTA